MDTCRFVQQLLLKMELKLQVDKLKYRKKTCSILPLAIYWLPREASSVLDADSISQLNNNPNAQNSCGGRSPCMTTYLYLPLSARPPTSVPLHFQPSPSKFPHLSLSFKTSPSRKAKPVTKTLGPPLGPAVVAFKRRPISTCFTRYPTAVLI